ncbi:hypothetical protein ACHWQZ_G012433 [Mnemiopsis leidyi]
MTNDGPKGSHEGAPASSTVDGASPPRLISSDSSDCSNCDGKKIPSDELVCCFVCQHSFHALCFVTNANDKRRTYFKDNTCSQTCLKSFKQAQAAKNSNKHFGSFVFICDICLTTKEQEKAKDVISHVSNLEQKILSMESDLTTIKNLLCENNSNAPVPTPQVIQPENPWCDTERVKKLRHPATMIIHDTSGEDVPLTSLESIITNNNIEANNTFKNKEGNTVITLSSQQDRSKLVNAIKENYPNSDIRQPNEKLPTISIAGIKEDISPDLLRDQILKVYQDVKNLVDAGETFTVLSVKQQRNYSGVNKLYQASVREILCANWNVRSLNNKIEQVMNFLQDNDMAILFVTETWLTDQHNNTTAQIRDHGYKIHHFSRSSKIGGGVALIYKSTVELVRVHITQFPTFEAVSAKLKMINKTVVLCTCIYRPPGPLSSFLTEFEDFLSYVFEKFEHSVICGDVNMHLDKTSAIINDWNTTLSSLGLQQLVTTATHKKGHILDPVISSLKVVEPSSVAVDMSVSKTFPKCDHYPIVFKFQVPAVANKSKKIIQFRNLKGMNHDQFTKDLTNAISNFNCDKTSFQNSLEDFHKACESTLDIHAPQITKTICDVPEAPWFDGEYKIARAQRRKAEKDWKKSKLEIDHSIFINIRQHCDELALRKKKSYFKVSVSLLYASYIGLQSGPQKSIDVLDGFIDPVQFFDEFVIPGKPVLFRGAAKTFPAFNKWTDEYFKSLPESDSFSAFAEEGKKENRDNVMWFSSGGTKSVWHNDAYENINCLMRGTKWFIMANRSETSQKAHIDMKDGAYSSVDVENVDVNKYPGFKDMQFYNVTMEAGDCLYIPWLWFHHVNSIGSNLAVNIWWRAYRTPLQCDHVTQLTFDQVHFKDGEDEEKQMPLNEAAHQNIYLHERMYTAKTIDPSGFLDSVGPALDERGLQHVTDEDVNKLFELLDSDRNGLLDYIEIDKILSVLPKFMLQFKDEL